MRVNSRLAAAGVMAALFVAGAVTGGAVVGYLDADEPRVERDGRRGDDPSDRNHRRDRDRGPRDPRVQTDRVVTGLARRLDLSADQRDSVRTVMEEQGREARRIFRQLAPELRALMDSTNVQIRAFLTPEQQAEFDALLSEDRNLLGRRYGPPDSADAGSSSDRQRPETRPDTGSGVGH